MLGVARGDGDRGQTGRQSEESIGLNLEGMSVAVGGHRRHAVTGDKRGKPDSLRGTSGLEADGRARESRLWDDEAKATGRDVAMTLAGVSAWSKDMKMGEPTVGEKEARDKASPETTQRRESDAAGGNAGAGGRSRGRGRKTANDVEGPQ